VRDALLSNKELSPERIFIVAKPMEAAVQGRGAHGDEARVTVSPGADLGSVLERVIAHYQPIVELGTGKVAGFEMLARIPEDAGPARSIGPLIEAIEGDPQHLERLMWRLLTAIKRDVLPLFARFPDFFVSVNVPPAMIGDGKIVEMLTELGLRTCVDRLVCEVTERAGAERSGPCRAGGRPHGPRPDRAGRLRHRQQRPGPTARMTFDVLKIDRSQVEHLLKDPTADRLVRGIVALASVLRARTVAEGVESAAQAFFLHAAGIRLRPGLVLEQGAAARGARADPLSAASASRQRTAARVAATSKRSSKNPVGHLPTHRRQRP
jgi:EAL domain-containing protein (putative c-di-GMP-specific phosphodiesterase class I)